MDSIKDLERQEIAPVKEDSGSSEGILIYAEEKLGYRHPERKVLNPKNPLTDALRTAGIKPLKAEAVDAYKAAQIKRLSPSPFWVKVEDSVLVWFVGHAGSFLCAVFSIFAIMLWLCQKEMGPKWPLISLGCTAACLAVYAVGHIAEKRAVTWHVFDLKGYGRPIPQFVLATAKEIDQRVEDPKLKFRIHELWVGPVPQEDPFLVAKLDGAAYYVEAWEESDFKQERVV